MKDGTVWLQLAALNTAATALALAERKRRKDEEARQAAEAQRKAAARNAAEALQRIQNWLSGSIAPSPLQKLQARPAALDNLPPADENPSSFAWEATMHRLTHSLTHSLVFSFSSSC
ncbi:MAG: hypothetical protein OHK0010_27910 [Anaerolineales bacterium]